eukprot:s95_g14.t2
MSLEKMPDLGTKPVSLTIKLPALKNSGTDRLADGLRELYKRGEFTDVALVCADRTFYAHRIVLAAESEVFKSGLATVAKEAVDGRQEIRLAEISNPEAVKFMLDYMYQTDASVWKDYNPRTQEINKDVLRLAQAFRLPGLTERAMHWLAKDLSTGNVVEVLTICEDFGLNQLGDRILEQLTTNKKALAEVANSPQIMKYPKLMQALLQQAAAVPEEPQPKKRPSVVWQSAEDANPRLFASAVGRHQWLLWTKAALWRDVVLRPIRRGVQTIHLKLIGQSRVGHGNCSFCSLHRGSSPVRMMEEQSRSSPSSAPLTAQYEAQSYNFEADRARRLALQKELEELQRESEHGKQVLDNLAVKIQSLRAEVERQRKLKPERGCSSCHAVTLQVDAAAQSLLGAAGHVARTLLRDPSANRSELLSTVLQYVEPVKHLDPDLDNLYSRAQASLNQPQPGRSTAQAAGYHAAP